MWSPTSAAGATRCSGCCRAPRCSRSATKTWRLLYPGADPAGLAAHWLESGVKLVVVTRGAQGAWAWTATAHVAAPPVRVAVVDTVGAGDTFQAALLATLAERGLLTRDALDGLSADTLQQVLGFAAQAAAITCSRRGADLPRRAELPAA
jgi:fructokinase